MISRSTERASRGSRHISSDPLGLADPQGLAAGKFIYAGCSDGQIVRCVEKCRAEGKIMQDCTQVYVQIPGVNGENQSSKIGSAFARRKRRPHRVVLAPGRRAKEI